jgi:hypothetical protein
MNIHFRKYSALTLLVLLLNCLLSISAKTAGMENTTLIDPYPQPPTPSVEPNIPESLMIYIPLVKRPWSYLPGIIVPPYSFSHYVTDFGASYTYLNSSGCDFGHKVVQLEGTHNFFVLLDFGRAYQFGDGTYGSQLINTYQAKHLYEIQNAIINFASGFYTCSLGDYSNVIIGIGINNSSSFYTGYSHGYAWGAMVAQTNSLITQYQSKVSVVGAANFELGMNGPNPTISWVNGYKYYMDQNGLSQFPLFVVGDAAGCPTLDNNTDCGSEEFPSWSTWDVWYVNYGSDISFPIPEIYSNDWSQAEQWLMLSLYSDEYTAFGPIYISGSFTQKLACQQETNDPSCLYLDNSPEEGYKMLYTVLYSKTPTRNVLDALSFSSDISYIPTPTLIP